MTTYKQVLERLELESFCKTFDTSPEKIDALIKEHERSRTPSKSKAELSKELDEVLASLEAQVIETDE